MFACPHPPSPPCPTGWVGVLAILTTPPPDVVPGRFYRVEGPAEGAFEGQEDRYAIFDPMTGWLFCVPSVGDKVTVIGTQGYSEWDGTAWVTSGGGSPPVTYTGQNIAGAGQGLYVNTVDGVHRFRRIRGTSPVSVNLVGEELVVSATIPPGGSGEINAGVNVGVNGAGVYKDKASLNLRFRKLYNDDGTLSIVEEADQVRLRATVSGGTTYGMTNVGTAGEDLYHGISGNIFQIRRLYADTADSAVLRVESDAPNQRVKVIFAPQNGTLDLFGDAENLYDTAPDPNDVMVWDTTLKWIHRPLALSSLGTGEAVYAGSPSALAFTFKSLKEGAGMQLTGSADEVLLEVKDYATLLANGPAVGGSVPLVASGPPWVIKQLQPGAGILLDAGTGEDPVTIEATAIPWTFTTDNTTGRALEDPADRQRVVAWTASSPVTVLLAEDLPVGFEAEVIQRGTGSVTFATIGAATIESIAGTGPAVSARHGRARVIVVGNVDGSSAVWNVSGDIA